MRNECEAFRPRVAVSRQHANLIDKFVRILRCKDDAGMLCLFFRLRPDRRTIALKQRRRRFVDVRAGICYEEQQRIFFAAVVILRQIEIARQLIACLRVRIRKLLEL